MLDDTTVTICEKPYFFKRYKNKRLLEAKQKVIDASTSENNMDKATELTKEYDKLVNELNMVEEMIILQTEKFNLAKSDKDKLNILNRKEDLYNKRLEYQNELEELNNKIKERKEDIDATKIQVGVLTTFADMLDVMLIDFDKEDFIENSSPIDLLIARYIEDYYAMALIDSTSEEIEKRIQEVVGEELLGS